MYDAIVVGARVAGSATAMLLARRGYRVLLVDRDTFPSDTLSTHQIQIPGSLALKRWGLLDRVLATSPGIARRIHFDMGDVVLDAEYPDVDGVDFIQSPRRYILDNILLEAAVEAGVEVRQAFAVRELVWQDDGVKGIRGGTREGAAVAEEASLVIGADGRHSLVARAVQAPTYNEHPALTCGYYSYWQGLAVQGGEIYRRGRRLLGVWPTSNNQTLIYTAWPASEFSQFRSDVEANHLATIETVPALAERVRQALRTEPVRGTGETPNFYRRCYGPGWALVGDAGYMKDPVTGYGISDAFRDAELLTAAIHSGFSGEQPLATALADYEQQRNAASRPFFEQTLDTASLHAFAPEQLELLRALSHDPESAKQFFGVLTGVIQPADFFVPKNVFRMVGLGGMARIMAGKFLHRSVKTAS